MKNLPSNRYALTVLEQQKSQVILYHPSFVPHCLSDIELLRNNEISFTREAKNNLVHNFFQNSMAPLRPFSEVEVLKKMQIFSMKSVSPPYTLVEEEYLDWLKDKKVAITELFDHDWELATHGSSRSFILSHVQVKGSGRALPPFTLWFHLNSGIVYLQDAIMSYCHSHLVDTSLPLGSNQGIGVLYSPEEKNAYYLRSSRFPRLAQIGKSLPEDIRKTLLNDIKLFHGTSSIKAIFKRILAQIASMIFIGAKFHMNPDNFLLNGHPIDEEDWIWPQDFDHWNFYINFSWNEKSPPPLHLAPIDFPWSSCNTAGSTFSQAMSAIRNFKKVFDWLGEESLSHEEALEIFYHQLNVISEDESASELWKSSINALSNFPKAEWNQWIKKMEEKGAEFKWFTLVDKNHLMLKIQIPRKNGSIEINQKFNSIPRLDFNTMPIKMLKLFEDGSIDPKYLSRRVNSLIARNGYILNFSPDLDGNVIENSISWKDYIQELLENFSYLNPQSLVIFNGKNESTLHWPPSAAPNEFIPLAIRVSVLDGEVFEIPLKKRRVYNT